MAALPTNGELLKLASRFASDQALADHLGRSRSTVRDHINRQGARKAVTDARAGLTPPSVPERAGLSIKGDDATLTTKPAAELRTPEEAIRARGLDPAEWEVRDMIVNEWEALGQDSQIVTMRQLKLFLSRRAPIKFVFPAVETTYRAPQKWRQPASGSELVVFVGDQQAPYQDAKLHDLFRQWLARNRPHRGVLIGDTVDFPSISRHKDNPEWHVSVQECINAGYLVLRDYVRASEGTRWQKLMGNHDERIRNELLNRAERLYKVRPADVPGEAPEEDALSLRRLLHLDALGIELIQPKGNYTHAQIQITPQLVARHGWLTGRNAADASLKSLSHSLIVGHTHKQSKSFRTSYDAEGRAAVQEAVETGCMCRIEEGLGYAVDPNWVNGFATASVWPDGRFVVDLAKYVDGVLYWRKQRYS